LQIRVFIVSKVRLHREGLAALLSGCPSIYVSGSDNEHDTQNTLPTTPTDVALIDALSPNESGTVEALRKICSKVRILAVGVRGDLERSVGLCRRGGVLRDGSFLQYAASRRKPLSLASATVALSSESSRRTACGLKRLDTEQHA
jgi:hypothetical protein